MSMNGFIIVYRKMTGTIRNFVNFFFQTCTLQIDNHTTAKDLLSQCIGKFHITVSEIHTERVYVYMLYILLYENGLDKRKKGYRKSLFVNIKF